MMLWPASVLLWGNANLSADFGNKDTLVECGFRLPANEVLQEHIKHLLK